MTFLQEGATTATGEGIEGSRPKAPDQSSQAATEWVERGWRSSGGAARGGGALLAATVAEEKP